ncbi:MAG: DNA mismatch repair endonuclease MutL [Verrucomicrobiota bacterium JB023]|nr:DNA mismatch repair endonuclease MutL [Verrucomicrobiota bacterium JB023]
MGKINVMPEVLASQVAAGEVVERPASVVKELMENALDAGAREVVVEVQRGGIAAMKVRDDGCGMSREDALMSLERHATSKLRSVDELEGILTLGFRGEAVPSIASVARFRLTTREKKAEAGTEIVVEGGRVTDVRDAGCAGGTEVEVRDLFFNVPARRKFLRTEQTESGHVEHEVRMHALASPGVRFVFRKDGRTVFDVPASKDARVRIAELDGRQLMRSMKRVDWQGRGVKVSGYVMPPDGARQSRRGQAMFLNGRPVDDRVVWKAVADAYGERLGKGMSPVAWLWLEMEPGLVDVNVHPAKKEVRFHRPSDVRAVLIEGVARALKGEEGRPPEREKGFAIEAEAPGLAPTNRPNLTERNESPASDARPTGSSSANIPTVAPTVAWVGQGTPSGEKVVETPPAASPSPAPAEPVAGGAEPLSPVSLEPHTVELTHQPELTPAKREGAESFRLVGTLRDRFYLLEGSDGLVLMDPRSARERIVYERLMGRVGPGMSQGMLVPVVLHLDPRDHAVLLANQNNFEEVGIALEEFGGNAVQVRSAPDFLPEGEVEDLIVRLVDELTESEGQRSGRGVAFEVFAKRFAKLGARGERARTAVGEKLLEELFRCELPYCTADGRPTLIHYSFNELNRRFGRK